MGEMAIAQDRFVSLMDLINDRSRFLRETVQAKLKAAKLNQEYEGSLDDLVRIIGEGDFQELTNLSNQMIRCVDQDVDRLHALANRFGSSLGKYFPKVHLRLDI